MCVKHIKSPFKNMKIIDLQLENMVLLLNVLAGRVLSRKAMKRLKNAKNGAYFSSAVLYLC